MQRGGDTVRRQWRHLLQYQKSSPRPLLPLPWRHGPLGPVSPCRLFPSQAVAVSSPSDIQDALSDIPARDCTPSFRS